MSSEQERDAAARPEGTAEPPPRPGPGGPGEPREAPDTARRAQGPVETEPDDGPRPPRTVPAGGGHVGADLDWVDSDMDDPDGGSGRTDADDGGYLPGEGTGRPPA